MWRCILCMHEYSALRTHSAYQAPLWGSLVTDVEYCLRVRQC